mmetsp:Transcript_57321/g.115046  ORF Transcript_57321/g.115046 Transcript_57321/m.115046 type:complete len:221 (+) Transcript_57321:245-907(+)
MRSPLALSDAWGLRLAACGLEGPKPLAHVPTTRHTPSGLCPSRTWRTMGLAWPMASITSRERSSPLSVRNTATLPSPPSPPYTSTPDTRVPSNTRLLFLCFSFFVVATPFALFAVVVFFLLLALEPAVVASSNVLRARWMATSGRTPKFRTPSTQSSCFPSPLVSTSSRVSATTCVSVLIFRPNPPPSFPSTPLSVSAELYPARTALKCVATSVFGSGER